MTVGRRGWTVIRGATTTLGIVDARGARRERTPARTSVGIRAMSQSNGESAGARATAALATARTRGRAVRKSLEMGRSRSRASTLDATPRRRRCGSVRGEHLRIELPRECELDDAAADPRASTQVSRGRG